MNAQFNEKPVVKVHKHVSPSDNFTF